MFLDPRNELRCNQTLGHKLNPRVFISYSWTSPGHQARIRQWAEQMVGDGIDVVLDVWELAEGDDKYAFMEKMVTDSSVTHVLVFSDSEYSKKADARKAGVGTESQIISSEIYSKVKQSKFIPIVCEFDTQHEPCLPVFLKSRIWIDFSSPESANENWEQLVRALYGKPIHEKPSIGTAPGYLAIGSSLPASPALSKFSALRQAIIQQKKGIKHYRNDFLESCYEYADALRVRRRPEIPDLGAQVLEDCGKLKTARDHIVDWILLESELAPSSDFDESIVGALERLLDLKSRPAEVNSWNDAWFDAHSVFVYETFLYIVAALLKNEAFESLNMIFSTSYLSPESHVHGNERFANFGAFLGFSDSLQILAPEGKRLHAPAAELIKRQADRKDTPFESIIQAELLVLMMAFVADDVRWYPQTLHYWQRSNGFPFFVRATQHRNFKKLAAISGISSADELRLAVKAGHERLGVKQWHSFWMGDRSFWNEMNMDALDTLR